MFLFSTALSLVDVAQEACSQHETLDMVVENRVVLDSNLQWVAVFALLIFLIAFLQVHRDQTDRLDNLEKALAEIAAQSGVDNNAAVLLDEEERTFPVELKD